MEETEFTLEQRVDEAWEPENPVRTLKGVLQELRGLEKKRAVLYFADATHSITVPFTKRITAGATRCKFGGKSYLVGAAINARDACQTLELFLCEMAD